MENILQQLEKRREEARLGGGKKRVEAQHEKGKLTARERLEVLLDRTLAQQQTAQGMLFYTPCISNV
jgi:acetyl-CoA carboxylase carboxyltransferase component